MPFLYELTAEIVSAHVANNKVPPSEVAELVSSVGRTLSNLGDVTPEVLEPSVAVRNSIKPDHIVCLDCGKKFKAIKRHISSEHGLSPDDYRSRWGLPDHYPMVAASYSKLRSEMAKNLGLGRKPGETVMKLS